MGNGCFSAVSFFRTRLRHTTQTQIHRFFNHLTSTTNPPKHVINYQKLRWMENAEKTFISIFVCFFR